MIPAAELREPQGVFQLFDFLMLDPYRLRVERMTAKISDHLNFGSDYEGSRILSEVIRLRELSLRDVFGAHETLRQLVEDAKLYAYMVLEDSGLAEEYDHLLSDLEEQRALVTPSILALQELHEAIFYEVGDAVNTHLEDKYLNDFQALVERATEFSDLCFEPHPWEDPIGDYIFRCEEFMKEPGYVNAVRKLEKRGFAYTTEEIEQKLIQLEAIRLLESEQ